MTRHWLLCCLAACLALLGCKGTAPRTAVDTPVPGDAATIDPQAPMDLVDAAVVAVEPTPRPPLEVVRRGDSESVRYGVERGGEAIELPAEVAAALDGAAVAPVATRDRDAVLYLGGGDKVELRIWSPGAVSRRLVQFHAGYEGASAIRLSPAGRVALIVVNQPRYPKGTRLFVLTLGRGGAVAGKKTIDASIFFECGGNCYPADPVWVDERTLEVTTRAGPGEKGPARRIDLGSR